MWSPDDGWTVSVDPLLRIGTGEGDAPFLFSNVEGVLLRADGGLIVADRASSEIRFFDSAGQHERTVGRAGEGPGEFGYIRGISRCGGDSLFVFELDHQNKVFTSDGVYRREARPFDAKTVDRRPYQLRCADNGYYVAVGWEPRVASGGPSESPPPIGFYRAQAPAWILAPTHAVQTGITTIEHAQLVIVADVGTFLSSERIGTANGSRPHPFGRSLRLAISRDGIILGTGETTEVRQYSYDGTVARILRWPAADLTIRPEDIIAYRTAQLAEVSEDRRPALERSLLEMPMPPAFPAYTRLEGDPDGNIWAEEFSRPSQPAAHWTVFSRSGELLGRMRVPDDLEITDIGSDRLVGIERDYLGVERIVVYEIRKPTPDAVRT